MDVSRTLPTTQPGAKHPTTMQFDCKLVNEVQKNKQKASRRGNRQQTMRGISEAVHRELT
jgi:hypothetical protein